ncbi:24384_t:CDS:2, partial [Dentiscutata erythropus]
MIKFLFFIILIFVLVNAENSNKSLIYDDSEIINPTEEGVENIFDLMIVIFLFLLTDMFSINMITLILNFILELFVNSLAIWFIKRAHNATENYIFIQYLITYSIKIYLISVAIFVTLTEKIEKKIKEDQKKSKKNEVENNETIDENILEKNEIENNETIEKLTRDLILSPLGNDITIILLDTYSSYEMTPENDTS